MSKVDSATRVLCEKTSKEGKHYKLTAIRATANKKQSQFFWITSNFSLLITERARERGKEISRNRKRVRDRESTTDREIERVYVPACARKEETIEEKREAKV